MINGSSSVIAGASANVDYIENISGYRTNVALASTSLNGTTKGQRCASDTGLGVAFGCGSANNVLIKATLAESISLVTINGIVNFLPQCIIWKSSGRFLVGGKFGKVYEVDTSGNIQDELTVTVEPNTGLLSNYNGSQLVYPNVFYMSLDGNLLLVSTDQSVVCYDYSLPKLSYAAAGYLAGGINAEIILCSSSSGETLTRAYNVFLNVNNTVKEFNFTTYAPQVPTSEIILDEMLEMELFLLQQVYARMPHRGFIFTN